MPERGSAHHHPTDARPFRRAFSSTDAARAQHRRAVYGKSPTTAIASDHDIGAGRRPAPEAAMAHKFSVGTSVYFEGGTLTPGSRGLYKIVRRLPIEGDNRLCYRIKSAAESFERTAEEFQLSRGD
jgi:hypothetical protein